MSQETGGSGGIHSRKETGLIRASFGPQVSAPLDLNMAKLDQLTAHPLIGRRLANKLVNFRKKGRITNPTQLYYNGMIDHHQLRKFEAFTFGVAPIRPLMQRIEIDSPRLYVDEAFAFHFAWLAPTAVSPLILSVRVRFPSGRTSTIHIRLSRKDVKAGQLTIPGFSSGESGELYALATLRDETGGGHSRARSSGFSPAIRSRFSLRRSTLPSQAGPAPPSTISATIVGIATPRSGG
jgi:hypothetical protein